VPVKLFTAFGFYRLINRLSDIEIPKDTGDFRLVSRRALDAVLAMPEKHRFLRGMFAWVGFRQVPIDYDRAERFAGETKYPFAAMMKFAVTAITSFSVCPLRLAMMFASVFAAASFLAISLRRGWTFSARPFKVGPASW
jgi:dolichol-phosphate mannosyltransferase